LLLLALGMLLTVAACAEEEVVAINAENAFDSPLRMRVLNDSPDITVHEADFEVLESGDYRFIVKYTAPEGRNISVFDPPNGDLFFYTFEQQTAKKKDTLTFELSAEFMEKTNEVTLYFWVDGGAESYIGFIFES